MEGGFSRKRVFMILYSDDPEKIKNDNFVGFFENWSSPPCKDKQIAILTHSSYVILALDTDTNKIIGFVTCITDKILFAYIPLFEVLPHYRKKGIAKELIKRIESKLSDLYAIDICCDENICGFYKNLGYMRVSEMVKRNYSVLK